MNTLPTNKFIVWNYPNGVVRLVFQDQQSDEAPSDRAAIAMSRSDALQLRDLLNKVLSPVEPQQ